MEAQHLSAAWLDRFAKGELDDEELSATLRHLESCPSCARAGRATVQKDLAALREDFLAEPSASRPSRAWIAGLAAAAAVVLAVLGLLTRAPSMPDAPPQVLPAVSTKPIVPAQRPGYGRPAWDAIVRAARAGEPLPMPPELRRLRRPADILRGPEAQSGQTSPSGVVLETTRPTFTWKARRGDRSTVLVLAGDREVVRSESLTTATWTAPLDLPRGITYTWQVEVDRNGELEVLPAPPAQAPQFHILDATHHAEVEAARRQHPSDPLFLGIIYARAGLLDDARTELRRVRDGDGVPTAQRLLHELDSWPARPGAP